MEKKSFETALIVVGLFLVLVEFFNFNTNLGYCFGDQCYYKLFHYAVLAVGIAMIVWGVRLFNPSLPNDEEWLIEWRE